MPVFTATGASTDTPMFELIRRTVEEQYKGVSVGPLILPFSSNDSRYLRTRGIPVLILTSNTDESTAARCRAGGAREVLRKPIQPQPLLEALGRHLPSFTPSPART